MKDRVRTYPELIAEKDAEIERLRRFRDIENPILSDEVRRLRDLEGVVMCLEAQIAYQDEEIARLKKLADVQQNTCEFLSALAHVRAVKLNELLGEGSEPSIDFLM